MIIYILQIKSIFFLDCMNQAEHKDWKLSNNSNLCEIYIPYEIKLS